MRFLRRALLLCALLPACSSTLSGGAAGAEGVDAGSGADREDEPGAPDAGASPDAAPVEVTLSHSASEEITPDASLRCNSDNATPDDPSDDTHADNAYLRAFDLESFGVAGELQIREVRVGVQEASGGGASGQPATLRLYTVDGPLVRANLILLGESEVTVQDQVGTVLSLPIDVVAPASATIVVELSTPVTDGSGHSFWMGSNKSGQTGPSMLSSTACGFSEPTDLASLAVQGFDPSTVHYVMSVVGEQAAP